MSNTTKRRRLRLVKDTLRTLTAVEASAVAGGRHAPPFTLLCVAHTHAPGETRFCLAGEDG